MKKIEKLENQHTSQRMEDIVAIKRAFVIDVVDKINALIEVNNERCEDEPKTTTGRMVDFLQGHGKTPINGDMVEIIPEPFDKKDRNTEWAGEKPIKKFAEPSTSLEDALLSFFKQKGYPSRIYDVYWCEWITKETITFLKTNSDLVKEI